MTQSGPTYVPPSMPAPAAKVASAFDRLTRAVEDAAAPPLTAAANPGPMVPTGRTIEDMVGDMLRPMLKDWMDQNLPPMVERLVEREIAKLTRR